MPGATIHVIGLGVESGARLCAPAHAALDAAQTIIGSPRQQELARGLVDRDDAQWVDLPKLAELKTLIDDQTGSDVVVLASGDPLYYGIGRWLGHQFEATRLRFYPALSSIQAMCNRLGLAQQDCRVISLHGRHVSGINRVLKQNRDIIVLTDRHSHPRALAQACIAAGFEQSRMYLGEDIGSASERFREFAVTELAADDTFECSELHVSVIRTRGRGGVMPEFPGIDDHRFATDGASGQGMFTKREVRLALLALLQPGNGDVIWDIGAGCGGVATELSHWNESVSVYAVEQHPERLACLAENRRRFGCAANLHIVDGRAPAVLADLPDPDKVFVGGNDGELEAILKVAWQRLPAGGLLVASAVTETTAAALQVFAQLASPQRLESLQLLVKRGVDSQDGQGDVLVYKPKLPVTLFKFEKSAVAA